MQRGGCTGKTTEGAGRRFPFFSKPDCTGTAKENRGERETAEKSGKRTVFGVFSLTLLQRKKKEHYGSIIKKVEKRRDSAVKRESAKKIIKAGLGVIVTVVSVTLEILGDILRKKPKQD